MSVDIYNCKSSDTSLKLYIPANCKQTTLEELIVYNSNADLRNADAVFCSNPGCNRKTEHTLRREYSSDLFIIEVIRVTESKSGWSKTSIPISFKSSNLKLPGSDKSYKVVSSCHHRGSLKAGHWFTKELTCDGWYELDDLIPKNRVTYPPGLLDNSVVVLLIAANDKF